jgi:hypoxanthine phosphoribosyltransferase
VSIPTLRLIDIDNLATELGTRIRAFDFSPSCIVYIDRAGRYIGLRLADFFHCKCLGVSAARKGGRTKEIFRLFLKPLPESVTHFLRRIEVGSGFHAVNKERHVKFIGPTPGIEDYIVVVDDAVDSGYSMSSVVKFLESFGCNRKRILTTAITVAGRRPIHRPDIFIYDHLITFPWSVGSRYYDEYIEHENRNLRA